MTTRRYDSIGRKFRDESLRALLGQWTIRGAFWLVMLVIGLVPLFRGIAQDTTIIHVPYDYGTIGEALGSAPDRAIIEITAGDYRESLLIERPVTLRSDSAGEVTLSGPDDMSIIQVVETNDVIIEGLTIVGGEYGIFVTHSQHVTIRENVISSSHLAGVKVRLGAADILNNTIQDADPPYGKGIHITNTTQWPASRIIGNTISGNARSGIVTNMTSMVFIQDNEVRGNGQRGITITEMSNATVRGNVVDGNVESGILVTDRSMADICGNSVMRTEIPIDGIPAGQGNGIVVDFDSEAMLSNNMVFDNANHGISVLIGSIARLGPNAIQNNAGSPVQATHPSQLLEVPILTC